MVLYHGSNVPVKEPHIIETKRFLDFGAGFYTTTDFEQAKKWAIRRAERLTTGKPCVSVYEISEKDFATLCVKIYKKADSKWLDFVTKCRLYKFDETSYDIIIGPVADDQTMTTLAFYFSGIYDVKETLRRLKTEKLKDQIVFKNQSAIDLLTFTESKEAEK